MLQQITADLMYEFYVCLKFHYMNLLPPLSMSYEFSRCRNIVQFVPIRAGRPLGGGTSIQRPESTTWCTSSVAAAIDPGPITQTANSTVTRFRSSTPFNSHGTNRVPMATCLSDGAATRPVGFPQEIHYLLRLLLWSSPEIFVTEVVSIRTNFN